MARVKTRDIEEGPLPADATIALRQGRVIEAIKILRAREGLGLKEAKERVERALAADPAAQHEINQRGAELRRTIIRWALIIDVIVVAAVIWYFFGRS